MADAQFSKSSMKSFYFAPHHGFLSHPYCSQRGESAFILTAYMCMVVHTYSQRVHRPPPDRPPTLKETAAAVSSAVNHQLILAGVAAGGHRRRLVQGLQFAVADRCRAEIERGSRL